MDKLNEARLPAVETETKTAAAAPRNDRVGGDVAGLESMDALDLESSNS